jgi:multidrug resistance efflux pump
MMRDMRGKWILFAGIVVFLAAGAGAVVWYKRQAPAPRPKAAAVQELPKGAEIVLTGKIQAANVVRVAAPLDGVAEEFPVKPGDEVYEGQILGRITNDALVSNEKDTAIELDRAQAKVTALESDLIAVRLEDSRLAADAARARAEMQRAERAYRRQEQLNAEGATPKNTFRKAEEDYLAVKSESDSLSALSKGISERIQQTMRDIETAKKALTEKEDAHEAAKGELTAANILSPTDGLILTIRKSAGDQVDRSMKDLIEIATELSQLEFVIEADDPRLFKRLAAGQPALIQIAEIPGDGIPATVKSVDESTIVLEFASPSPLLRPGMTAVAKLKLN